MNPNATEYKRGDGSTYIVARTNGGRFVIIGQAGSYESRRDAVKAGAA